MIKVKATIELLKSQEGRKTPFKNGYQPGFIFNEAPTQTSGRIDLIGRDELSPGMDSAAFITFNKGIIDDKYFRPGELFSFAEGPITVGKGKIVEVIENTHSSYLDNSNDA